MRYIETHCGAVLWSNDPVRGDQSQCVTCIGNFNSLLHRIKSDKNERRFQSTCDKRSQMSHNQLDELSVWYSRLSVLLFASLNIHLSGKQRSNLIDARKIHPRHPTSEVGNAKFCIRKKKLLKFHVKLQYYIGTARIPIKIALVFQMRIYWCRLIDKLHKPNRFLLWRI